MPSNLSASKLDARQPSKPKEVIPINEAWLFRTLNEVNPERGSPSSNDAPKPIPRSVQYALMRELAHENMASSSPEAEPKPARKVSDNLMTWIAAGGFAACAATGALLGQLL